MIATASRRLLNHHIARNNRCRFKYDLKSWGLHCPTTPRALQACNTPLPFLRAAPPNQVVDMPWRNHLLVSYKVSYLRGAVRARCLVPLRHALPPPPLHPSIVVRFHTDP